MTEGLEAASKPENRSVAEATPVFDYGENLIKAYQAWQNAGDTIRNKHDYQGGIEWAEQGVHAFVNVIRWCAAQIRAAKTPIKWYPFHPVDLTVAFHRAFGLPMAETPTIPPVERRLLRVKLIGEEFMEFARASGFPNVYVINLDEDRNQTNLEDMTADDERPSTINMVEAADANGDIRVVNDGSAVEWGFPVREIDVEIYNSNMSKLGDDGQPIRREDGKVLKGPKYKRPDIAGIIEKFTRVNS